MTITYDGVSILGATQYITRRAMHESSPDRVLNTLKLTRRDGEAIIDDSFAPKSIVVEGVLVGSSETILEQRIDELKELVARKDKNLDISFAGGTRRYNCRMTRCSIDRDHYNLTHVPYVITFFVASGIGSDTGITTPLNASGITATTDDRAVAFGGSYQPKPKHKITINTRGNADVARISNQDTGDYIEVDLDGFSTNDYFEVDEENQTVKKNGSTDIDFRGKFPSVNVGTNNLRLTIYGSGYTLDQEQTVNDGSSRSVIYTNTVPDRLPQQAQSVVLDQSGRIGKIEVFVDKDGSPLGKMQWHFRKDNNGVPGMTAGDRIGNEEFEIAAAGVPGSQAWTEAAKAVGSVFLKAGVKYWLFYNPGVITSSDVSNFFSWWYSNIATRYLKGKAMANRISGQPWEDGVGNAQAGDGVDQGQFDFMFKIYRGDGAAASHTVAWRIDYTKKYL